MVAQQLTFLASKPATPAKNAWCSKTHACQQCLQHTLLQYGIDAKMFYNWATSAQASLRSPSQSHRQLVVPLEKRSPYKRKSDKM